MFDVLTLAAAIGSALVAGILFIFSVCIMRALGTLPPPSGIAAMQAINVTILNPWFLSVFVGTAAACAIVLVWAVAGGAGHAAIGPVAASLLYLVGVVGITRLCNIPRNEALAKVSPASADAARVWADYLTAWTRWNHVRTAAALAAALLFLARP